MTTPERFTGHEPDYDSMFEVMYTTATSRLAEAFRLQQEGSRYFHVWEEHFHDYPGELAAYTLAADYEELIEGNSEHFDVVIPVQNMRRNEEGIPIDADISRRDEPFVFISTKKYDAAHRYKIARNTTAELPYTQDDVLRDLDSKLLTYKIVPFRIQEQTA